MLPRRARCVLSRLRCSGRSLFWVPVSLGLAGSGVLQCLWTLVPGHFSSRFALPSWGLFVPLILWQLSVSLQPLVQILGLSGFWGSMVPCHTPIPRKGSGNQPQIKVIYLLESVECTFLFLWKGRTQACGRYFHNFLPHNIVD